LTEYVEKHIPNQFPGTVCCDNQINTKMFTFTCGMSSDTETVETLCGDCAIVREHLESIECVGEDCGGDGTGWYERWDEHDDNTIETLKKWMVQDGFLRCNGVVRWDGVAFLTSNNFCRCCLPQQEVYIQFLVRRPEEKNDISKIPVFLRQHILKFLPICKTEQTWYSDDKAWKKSLERCENVICGSCVEECAEGGSILKSNDWLCPDCC